MPLTPEDVRNKQFTTVRLREGYDEDEVDAFLDEVEAELTRLLRPHRDTDVSWLSGFPRLRVLRVNPRLPRVRNVPDGVEITA